MDECIFCKIAKNEIPSYRIFEDEDFIAMLDIFPYSKGHTLIIPKEHYVQVWDIPSDLYLKYMAFTQKIALLLREKTGSEFTYCQIFGTDVPHAHIHLIPSLGKGFAEIFGNRTGEKIDEKLATEMQILFKVE